MSNNRPCQISPSSSHKSSVPQKTSDPATYHQAHPIQTLSLKNYVINEMEREGKKLTREESGITKNYNLSQECYENVQKYVLIDAISEKC